MSTTTLRFTHTVNGVLTDVTSVALSDPAGTFGARRTDTLAAVVADGTAMVRQSAGVYTYTFTDPAAGLTYNWWAEFLSNGLTSWAEFNTTGGTSEWDGRYVDPEKARDFAGRANLIEYTNLGDVDAGEEDPAVAQRYADKVDAYVDFLAEFVFGWSADDVPIATDHALFDQISDAASRLFVVEVYGARGMLDTSLDAAAGKMEDARAKADAYLRELLATKGTAASDDDASPWGMVPAVHQANDLVDDDEFASTPT